MQSITSQVPEEMSGEFPSSSTARGGHDYVLRGDH